MRRKMKTEIVGGDAYEYYPIGEHIVSAVGICDGRPTFKYTRIEVSVILAMLGQGDTVDDIVEDYEGRVSREAILEAVGIAGMMFRTMRTPQTHKKAS
jgi:uncharacterized protein (DUF433 family)